MKKEYLTLLQIERIRQHLKQSSSISGLQQFQVIYDELVMNDRITNEVN